jgi:glycosyltransferase involved in cell wall biosynthesis
MDVFVLPSLAEGISNTILEAMAAGLPVVATRVGGNPELIQDGGNGILVPQGNPEALATAVATYLHDPHLLRVHGKSSRARAIEAFGLERMRGAYRNLYLELATERGLLNGSTSD